MANVLGELFQNIADAIRGKTGGTDSMKPLDFPEAIAGIEAGSDKEVDQLLDEINGEVVGQKLCYVTIMSEDGLEEFMKVPVYEGYNAEDPFGTGPLGIPTKESTNTQVFTYTGLSQTPGGEADPSALLNVTEDRTVYIAFKTETRYYTVRFFDGDTLMTYEKVVYGASPSYTPKKTDYIFIGWEPSNKNITADTDCYAQWEEITDFDNATLARISESCESGRAAEHFAIGDEREVTAANGTTKYVLRIVGIDKDTKADGSGKAGITVAVTLPNRTAVAMMPWTTDEHTGKYWDYDTDPTEESNVRYWLRTEFYSTLPADLQAVIKPVTKKTEWGYSNYGTAAWTTRESTDLLFIPSAEEFNFLDKHGSSEGMGCYPGFDTQEERTLYSGGVATDAYLRSTYHPDGRNTCDVYNHTGDSVSSNSGSYDYHIYPCFCI